MKRALLVAYVLLLVPVALADRSCDWHRTDPASELHYAMYHDGDKDGVGCEGVPRSSNAPGTSTTTSTATAITATETINTASTTPASATSTTIPTPVPISTRSTGGGLDGIQVAAEHRCSPYDRGDYSYPQSIELRIIAENLGGRIFSPYTNEEFQSRAETDIEHIVAAAEAHDSGLCAADEATRRRFARDLLNLTLASPSVNRHQKSDKDLAEWLPPQNRCWYVETVISVKTKYSLTMDGAEASVAARVLEACGSDREQPTAASDYRSTALWVRVLYSSNLRSRPGIENTIVGGSQAGREFPYVRTAGDDQGDHWYQMKLPRGYGWVRSDLAELFWR